MLTIIQVKSGILMNIPYFKQPSWMVKMRPGESRKHLSQNDIKAYREAANGDLTHNHGHLHHTLAGFAQLMKRIV
jgi:hypothetical protein